MSQVLRLVVCFYSVAAPEVIANSRTYDGKLADVWSSGVMLYVMLFCEYPFERPEDSGDPHRFQKVCKVALALQYVLHFISARLKNYCTHETKEVQCRGPGKETLWVTRCWSGSSQWTTTSRPAFQSAQSARICCPRSWWRTQQSATPLLRSSSIPGLPFCPMLPVNAVQIACPFLADHTSLMLLIIWTRIMIIT